ncbi:peptidoglycan DD-metalloendopeptidase family protein [Burkholderiaceae bacterium DAT-1]|nr:peptidoglycan DD-metalloendopeptidase family protein [Burkholderiaceae bacterium DAT-1]
MRRALILIMIGVCGPAVCAAKEPPARQDVDAIRQKIDEVKRELMANEANKADASDALRESEVAISDASHAMSQLDKEQQISQAELSRINADILRIRRNLDASAQRIKRILKTRYQNGRHEAMRLVLEGRAPAHIARQLEYYRYIAQAQQKLVNELSAQLSKLNELAEAIKQKSEALARLAAEKRKQKAVLEAGQAEKQQVLSRLSGEISQQRKQIGKLQADEKSMTQLVERIMRETKEREAREKQARDARQAATHLPKKNGVTPVVNDRLPDASIQGDFASLKGRLRLPLKGEILGRFGQAKADGLNWKGVFIRSDAGNPVKAIAAGQVAEVGWIRNFGNVILVEHGGDYITVYGAAESILKRKGEKVSAGEDIATAGNSGGNAETGIYFELRHRGQVVDPMTWVR